MDPTRSLPASPSEPAPGPRSGHRVPARGLLGVLVLAALGTGGLATLVAGPGGGLGRLALAAPQLALAGLLATRRGGRLTLPLAALVGCAVAGCAVAAGGWRGTILTVLGLTVAVGAGLLALDWHGPRVSARLEPATAVLAGVLAAGLVSGAALAGPAPVRGAPGTGTVAAPEDPSSHAGVDGHGHADHVEHADHAPGADADPSGSSGAHAHDPAALDVTVPTADRHAHTDASGTPTAGHDHATTDGTAPTGSTAPGGGHDHPTPGGSGGTGSTGPTGSTGTPSGPIVSLADPRLTEAQRARAQALLDVTRGALAPYAGLTDAGLRAALTTAGYQAIGDGGSFAHWVHWGRFADGRELDPAAIESVVLEAGADGHWRLGSAMYILNPGRSMADVPELAGELTTWHVHTNLCWVGTQLVGVAQGGVCAQGELRVTPPMLHVWVEDRACGPFAETEERRSGSCTAPHVH